MNDDDIIVHSIKEEYELRFHIIQEAIETIPHSVRMYIPKNAETWLRENCNEDCYLISLNRDYLRDHYLALFVNPIDAVYYVLVWR